MGHILRGAGVAAALAVTVSLLILDLSFPSCFFFPHTSCCCCGAIPDAPEYCHQWWLNPWVPRTPTRIVFPNLTTLRCCHFHRHCLTRRPAEPPVLQPSSHRAVSSTLPKFRCHTRCAWHSLACQAPRFPKSPQKPFCRLLKPLAHPMHLALPPVTPSSTWAILRYISFLRCHTRTAFLVRLATLASNFRRTLFVPAPKSPPYYVRNPLPSHPPDISTWQAIAETGLLDVSADCLARAHAYIEQSQVVVEAAPPLSDYYRHISKGAWTFSTRDHGWPISDCSSEALKAALTLAQMPANKVCAVVRSVSASS